ncbi:hypothetical protein Tcan_16955 [Toxocara canis]|uniref:Uncharacterized protein n=1 Tax=Toxocara canis TaxID=6265 RepID=A0A0B2VF63_TOXCA|nr:hypothetical protein Tcan_16955 [Toxocara canis]
MPLDLIRRTPSPSNPQQTVLQIPSFKGKSVSTVDLRIEKKGFDDLRGLSTTDDDSVLTRTKKTGGKYRSTNDLSSTDKFLMDRNYMSPAQRIQISRPTSSLSASPPLSK